MPELPEVETVCRTIRPHILGRTIERISHSGKQLRVPVPYDAMCNHLVGQSIAEVSRRAKYLLVAMADGWMLAIHLGMTGNLGIFTPKTPAGRHCHLRFLLSDGRELRYADTRRFGSMQLLSPAEAQAREQTLFAHTGPEPFSKTFTGDYLHALAGNRSVAVKSFIMTNAVVAGVGNIYANESLYRAGIHPGRRVNRISKQSWQRLAECIRQVLDHAISCGGSTISDYLNGDQEGGYFQVNFQVYNRKEQPCTACTAPIRKLQIGGRASYYCPRCQH